MYIYIYICREEKRTPLYTRGYPLAVSGSMSRPFLLHELLYARRADSALNRERQKIYQAFNENDGIHRGWNF